VAVMWRSYGRHVAAVARSSASLSNIRQLQMLETSCATAVGMRMRSARPSLTMLMERGVVGAQADSASGPTDRPAERPTDRPTVQKTGRQTGRLFHITYLEAREVCGDVFEAQQQVDGLWHGGVAAQEKGLGVEMLNCTATQQTTGSRDAQLHSNTTSDWE
jgi:hypothetical protein